MRMRQTGNRRNIVWKRIYRRLNNTVCIIKILSFKKSITMEIYKKKWFFNAKMSFLGSVAYMLSCWDFILELTAKYRKEYKGEFWRNYTDVLNWNIERKSIENLQIKYIWSEWGKHKGKKLLTLWFDMKNEPKEKLMEIYLGELKKYRLD